MQVQCHQCGQPFEAERPHAKWCSATCRKQNQRASGASVTELRPAGQAEEEPVEVGPVTGATWRKLEEAERLDTPEGMTALALAHRLDHGGRDTGSALASVARELRATLAEALKGAAVEADPVDEIRARRERKLANGA